MNQFIKSLALLLVVIPSISCASPEIVAASMMEIKKQSSAPIPQTDEKEVGLFIQFLRDMRTRRHVAYVKETYPPMLNAELNTLNKCVQTCDDTSNNSKTCKNKCHTKFSQNMAKIAAMLRRIS